MKLHANARTCPNSRRLFVKRIEERGLVAGGGGRGRRRQRAHRPQVVGPLAGRGRGRPAGPQLAAEGCRPTPADRVAAIEALRRLRMSAAEIAEVPGGVWTVSRRLKRIGLGTRSRSTARAAEPL